MTIAYKRPLVILSAGLANKAVISKDPILFALTRIVIILLFPLVPAMIVISGERAKGKRESLKGKDYQIEDLAKNHVMEESDVLTGLLF